MKGFAEQARRELRTVGSIARKHSVTAMVGVELTAQEAQIAGLAGDGLSSPEIGTRLFLSPRWSQ
jgi:DNA-binding CsgD family transcriptional regulator